MNKNVLVAFPFGSCAWRSFENEFLGCDSSWSLPKDFHLMNLEITSSSNPDAGPKKIPIKEDTISSLDFARELGVTIYDNGYLNTGNYTLPSRESTKSLTDP